MRSLLFDTVSILRWGQGRVPRPVQRLVQRPDTVVYMSAVSPWEFRLKPQFSKGGWTRRNLLELAFDHLSATVLPVTLQHTEEFDQLPQFTEHTDPFDRMLIAQAMAEGYTLVSPDTRFPLYEPHGLKLLWE